LGFVLLINNLRLSKRDATVKKLSMFAMMVMAFLLSASSAHADEALNNALFDAVGWGQN